MSSVTRARNAVAWSFLLNGFGFASWAARIPGVRTGLSLSNGELGLLLLAISAGSVTALPVTGALVHRLGAARVVHAGIVATAVGLVIVGLAAETFGSVWLSALALVVYGMGVAVWDVAMNVEGAAVEQALGRIIMPRFHAAWSIGTVAGSMIGAGLVAVGLPMLWHFGVVALLMVGGGGTGTRWFLPAGEGSTSVKPVESAVRAWREPRTLLIGLMMMSLALTEGTANDWLAVALIDGYRVPHAVGVAGFGLFVSAMTLGRFFGAGLLDRHGRVPMLWGTMALAGAGVLVVVFGGSLPVVTLGILAWGVGSSLGFPVGISAASDDPARAAARVSVVTSIAYTAYLAGPPLLGFVADKIGALHALLFVSLLLIPSALVVPAARERRE